MRLYELGERRIIELFLRNITKSKGAVVGIGDDACVVEFGGEYLVISTDLLSRRTHFPWEMTPGQIGAYVINASLSDIAAMGATPFGMLVSLGLPKDLDEDFVGGIARGMDAECRKNNVSIIGGDTKAQNELVIVGTALGRVEKGRILTRSGARQGDLVCVTGSIGSAAAGFYCLTNGIKIGKFIKAALEPKARVKEGRVLSKYASACIDVSDGLAYSLHQLASQSGVGFAVREEDLPVDKDLKKVAEAVGVPVREMAMYKGGDYELLFTISPTKYDKAVGELKKVKGRVAVIGEVTGKDRKILTEKGVLEELEERGYDSFAEK